MKPNSNRGIPDERNLEKQIERQMGCMTGFLQLFDRHQNLAGKRFYPAKPLPSPPTSDSRSPSERSDVSSTYFVKAAPPSPYSPSPGDFASSPENHQKVRPPLPLPLPVFEMKDGVKTSWKLREAPRLSLDSRAVFDSRGKLRPRQIRTTPAVFSGDPSDGLDAGDDHDKHRRSPSVVARLMGLDALPLDCNEEQPKRSELRRSASESRVSRDLCQFNVQKLSPNFSEEHFRPRKSNCSEFRPRCSKTEPPRTPPDPLKRRKSFFEAQDFFPEPKRTGSMYDEIEKRFRMRGIEEPAKDLETLKQILEALQLKGLLHTKLPEIPSAGSIDIVNNCAFPISSITESPLTITKPTPKPLRRSAGIDRLPLLHRSASPHRPVQPEVIAPAKSQRNPVRKSLMRPFEPNGSSVSPISSPVCRKPVNVEAQRSSQPERRIPAFHSSLTSPKKLGHDQRSPRIRRPNPNVSPKENVRLLAEDDAFAFSNTSILHSSSQFDYQKASIEECRTGRSLLERCDKLLHSIAAITSSAEQVTATDQQPSPVSVLDSSFLSEENSASLLPKRSIDFKDQIEDWEDHPKLNPSPSSGSEFRHGPEKQIDSPQSDDYAFVADIIRETDRLAGPEDFFPSLQQQHNSFASFSTASLIHRRLLFDTVIEILGRKLNVSPWAAFTCSLSAAFSGSESSLLPEIWAEMQCLRHHSSTENVMELTANVIKQDMAISAAGELDWTVPGADMSAAVLHIERQLFKDLVADTIRELADLIVSRRRATTLLRRKLIF